MSYIEQKIDPTCPSDINDSLVSRFANAPAHIHRKMPCKETIPIYSRRDAILLTMQSCLAILPTLSLSLQLKDEQTWSDLTYWNDDCGWKS